MKMQSGVTTISSTLEVCEVRITSGHNCKTSCESTICQFVSCLYSPTLFVPLSSRSLASIADLYIDTYSCHWVVLSMRPFLASLIAWLILFYCFLFVHWRHSVTSDFASPDYYVNIRKAVLEGFYMQVWYGLSYLYRIVGCTCICNGVV